eukprot:ANDGO_07929.mRNA.1 hypothetical protein
MKIGDLAACLEPSSARPTTEEDDRPISSAVPARGSTNPNSVSTRHAVQPMERDDPQPLFAKEDFDASLRAEIRHLVDEFSVRLEGLILKYDRQQRQVRSAAAPNAGAAAGASRTRSAIDLPTARSLFVERAMTRFEQGRPVNDELSGDRDVDKVPSRALDMQDRLLRMQQRILHYQTKIHEASL